MDTEPHRRIEYLDWLRALAIALVLFGHSANWWVPGGAIGVSIFFVLSGYLITSILLRDGMLTPGNIAKFIVRRWARIYPMYLVQIILVVMVFATLQPDRLGSILGAVPGLLTFWQDPPGSVGFGFGVLWTLAIEFWFYATFPFLLWAAILTRQVGLCVVVGIALSLSAKFFGTAPLTAVYYDHFLIGSLCAVAIKFRGVPRFFHRPYLFVAGIAAILALAEIPYPGTRGFVWFCQSLTAAVVTGVMVLVGHVQTPTISIPWFAFLGRISYSVYLMHAVILDVFVIESPVPHFLWVFLVATLVVSTFTHYAIELPVERLAHRKIRYGIALDTLPATTDVAVTGTAEAFPVDLTGERP